MPAIWRSGPSPLGEVLFTPGIDVIELKGSGGSGNGQNRCLSPMPWAVNFRNKAQKIVIISCLTSPALTAAHQFATIWF